VRTSSTARRVVDSLDLRRHVAASYSRRLPLEFDRSSGAAVARLVAEGEPTSFNEKALALLGADEAVLLRWVEPKHGAAHVLLTPPCGSADCAAGTQSPGGRR